MPTSIGIDTLGRALARTLEVERSEPVGKAAAVAAIVREHGGLLEVLFIRRAEREGDPWSGHMAFPGGRREPADPSLLATAIRETHEEIGVDLVRVAELVGQLDDQDASGRGAPGALPIRPFVFRLHAPFEAVLSEEVTELVWAPIDELRSERRRTSVSIHYAGQPYTLPGWDLDGRVVWGLTYRMTRLLIAALETHSVDS